MNTVQEICIARATGPDCVDQTGTAARTVTRYGYLSLQRRFTFGSNPRLQPVFGIGAVANSDTNPYVSSPLTFSLSLGLRLGRQWSVEWRHFSNAGLAPPNLGQAMQLLRARFGQ
ncbi:MAG: acyloxyacyl hydrolase [Gammaproteobacteria bacterium]